MKRLSARLISSPDQRHRPQTLCPSVWNAALPVFVWDFLTPQWLWHLIVCHDARGVATATCWREVLWIRNCIFWWVDVDGFLMAKKMSWNLVELKVKVNYHVSALYQLASGSNMWLIWFDWTFFKPYLWCFIFFKHKESKNVTHVFKKCLELPQK